MGDRERQEVALLQESEAIREQLLTLAERLAGYSADLRAEVVARKSERCNPDA